MRVNVKNIGSQLTLDEYNAFQYLLYNMSCWKDRIILNTYTPYQGKYANYKLIDNDRILPEKNDNITIKNQFTSSNSYLTIQLSNLNPLLNKKNIEFLATLHIKKPTTTQNITINYTENGTNETITGNQEQHPIDNPEVNQFSTHESHPTPNVQTDYETITLSTIYTQTDNTIKIPLYQNNTPVFPLNTIINKEIDLQIKLNKKPYIDINNGRPNEINEILLDNPDELYSLIHFIPTDRTKTIIRLDSNFNYNLNNTLIIKNGQNIEIRGGTNKNAVINGSIVKRSIIIKPGGQLSLKNITLQDNNSNQTGVYDKGKGGAILIESQTKKDTTTFGVLECDNCIFQNNNAGTGGAIYSYHAGVYINNCQFKNNTANNGGAIYYYSQDIIMTMKDIYAQAGETINVVCEIKNYLGQKITYGKIKFYTNLDKNPQEYIVDIINGKATLNYDIPSDIKKKEFNITAIYSGSNTTDPEITKNTIYIKTKEEYSLVLENPPETINPGDWLILTATITNQNKEITNIPNAIFTYNNTSLNYTRINSKYQIKKQIPLDAKDKITVKFTLEESTDYTHNEVSTTIKVLEKPTTTVEEYITGLTLMDTKNKNNTHIDTYINKGITDLFINYNYSNLLNCDGINLYKGKNGENVKKLQTILKTLGYSITIDGDFGRETKSVVEKFQKDNPPLADDGVVGPVTCKVLNNKLITQTCEFIKNAETKKINLHILFDMNYDINQVSNIKTQIDALIKYKIKGFCFHNLRYGGVSDKVKNQMKWTINEDTKVKQITNTIKTLNEYIKSKGNYITTMTVMPDEEYNPPAYGQNYKKISENVDYIIPLVYEPQWNQNTSWVEKVIKYINTQINTTNILAQIITYTDDKNPTTSKRSKTELTNTINTLVKQNKIKGYILHHEAAITDYPTPYNKLMEVK